MDTDRRQSVRISISLPCQWQTFPSLPSRRVLLQTFADPAAVDLATALDCIDEALQPLLNRRDDAINDVLALINQKQDLLLQRTLFPACPPERSVVLGMNGMQVTTEAPLEQAAPVGVHMVLGGSAHVLAPATVSACREGETGFEVGLAFAPLAAPDQRALNRFIMRARSREQRVQATD